MIREAKAEEVNTIADIWLMSMRSAHPFFKDTYWTKQYKSIRQKYAKGRSDVVVYEENGALLGFGAYVRDARMVRVFVIPGFQRKGIGSALLQYFEAGNEPFFCRCYRNCRSAVTFLQNRGYRVMEKRRNVDSGEEEYLFQKQAEKEA